MSKKEFEIGVEEGSRGFSAKVKKCPGCSKPIESTIESHPELLVVIKALVREYEMHRAYRCN